MSKLAETERAKAISDLVRDQRLSYGVIAEMLGITRNAVAGVVFRLRHPPSVRLKSPRGKGRNKVGHGYQPRSYIPEKTTLNTR